MEYFAFHSEVLSALQDQALPFPKTYAQGEYPHYAMEWNCACWPNLFQKPTQNNHVSKALAEHSAFKTQVCTHHAVLFCAGCWHQPLLKTIWECYSILLEVVNIPRGPDGVQNKILWKVKRCYLSPESSEDSHFQSEIVPLCDRVTGLHLLHQERIGIFFFFFLDLEQMYTSQVGEYAPALLSFTAKE